MSYLMHARQYWHKNKGTFVSKEILETNVVLKLCIKTTERHMEERLQVYVHDDVQPSSSSETVAENNTTNMSEKVLWYQ